MFSIRSRMPPHWLAPTVTGARLPKSALIVDLAAPPGGVDFEAAKRLGVTAIWGRGLGSRAPVTVGASQWGGIRERIEKILQEEECLS